MLRPTVTSFTLYCRTLPPSLGFFCQSLASLDQAPIEIGGPCSPLAQEQPQPLQEQIEVPPSQPQDGASVCQAREWSDLRRQADQADL